MNFRQAQEWLASLQAVSRKEYLRNPADCAVYLKRLQFLLNILGNPERRIPHYVHVAGTSGKGSVCHMIEAMLRAAGRRTGLLTSPGATGLTDRRQVAGRQISKSEFATLALELKSALQKYIETSPYDLPSVFELLTALTLLHFARQRVEWAVVEVGLGGRYDSTNIIPWKDAAVITTIGLDHTDLLGSTREKIAYEKAGIVRRGCRVFTAEARPEILRVIKRECRRSRVALTVVECGLARVLDEAKGRITFETGGQRYTLAAYGSHQARNAALAIAVATALGAAPAALRCGLARVRLPLRFERLAHRGLVILDGAHNPDKMATTIAAARAVRERGEVRAWHLVIGFSADKNIAAMLRQLAALSPTTVACTRFTAQPFRLAASPAGLARVIKRLAPRALARAFIDPQEALAWARKRQTKKDGLLVTGSVFLAGELRLYLKQAR